MGATSCDVTNISVDDPAFSLDTTPFQLQAGESRDLIVQFAPDVLGPYAAAISLTSNDPDESPTNIAMSANAHPAPVASVAPEQLDVQMFAGSLHTETLTLSNTGGSDLVWHSGVVAADSLGALLGQAAALAVADLPDDPDLGGESGVVWAEESIPRSCRTVSTPMPPLSHPSWPRGQFPSSESAEVPDSS